jgi:hypothetical protein
MPTSIERCRTSSTDRSGVATASMFERSGWVLQVRTGWRRRHRSARRAPIRLTLQRHAY